MLFVASVPQRSSEQQGNNSAILMDDAGLKALERSFRFLPLRTGVPAPDWLIVDEKADQIGMAGLLGAGSVVIVQLRC